MIPNAPPASTRSKAEKKVFGLLEATRLDGSTCFHSLRLHKHRTKVSGEADFVIVMPTGVLVFEVKGGRIHQRSGGWVYVDREGTEHHSSEGPFRQAEGAMYALRDRLEELVGRRALDALPFGFAVVTPDCSLPTRTVEWGPEVLLDQSRLRGATDLSDLLSPVMQYWREERNVAAHVLATEKELNEVVAACRPDFDAIPTLRSRATELTTEMDVATTEQYRVLDMLGVLDRVVISGGAGSGKTWIAAEAARRHSEAGRRVLLTCHAPALASWLRTRVPDEVSVMSHSALAAAADRHDVLICDEAQDLMSEDGLERLDSVLANGLDAGQWMMFLDPQHQAGVRGRFDEEVYSLLLDRSGTGKALPLSENLRNTSNIVSETVLLTGARPGRARVTGGDPVRTRYAETSADEAAILRSWLKELRGDDMSPGSITILTPEDGAGVLDQLPASEQRRVRRLAASGAGSWPLTETTICSVAEFKGLENDVVILAGLWDVDPVEQCNMLYVALTRARIELRVIWPEAHRGRLDDLRMSHVEALGAH